MTQHRRDPIHGPRSLPSLTVLAILVTLGSACSSGGGGASVERTAPVDAPILSVPHFEADDPRIETAGFVGLTTRVSREASGTTHTLMIFAVDDVLTLGAMVEGDFEGTVHWEVGDRTFSVPLSRSNRGRREVAAEGRGLAREYGGFDAFDWVNVEVPLDAWLPDGTPVRLEFRPEDGAPLSVPAEGRLVSRVEAR